MYFFAPLRLCGILCFLPLDDLAAPETPCAHFDAFCDAVDFRSDLDQIRPEFAYCLVIGMADSAADHSFFPVNIALT